MPGILLLIPKYVLYTLHIFSALCLALVFATNCYFLSKKNFRWSIRANLEPKYNLSTNIGFFVNLSSLFFLLFSILCAVVEICFIIKVKQVESFQIGFQRPITYILIGIVTLGICGDLGIAAGSLLMISGAIWLVIAIIAMRMPI